MQVVVLDEPLQPLLDGLPAERQLASEAQVCKPGPLADQQAQVVTVQALRANLEQARQRRIADQVVAIREDLGRHARLLEHLLDVNPELAQRLRKSPDRADAQPARRCGDRRIR